MAGPLWKGRFSGSPDRLLMSFSRSLDFDRRLWPQDVAVTGAHAAALARAGLLSAGELAEVRDALEEAKALFGSGEFPFDDSDEDIHSCLERFLTQRLGDAGAKIHAGRSRNDLVATDLRLWLKEAIPRIASELADLQSALMEKAREYRDTPAPGFTHLQRAQPILLAHHLLAHAFAFGRDFERFAAAHAAADVCPLGAAALAGTTLPLDAAAVAAELGFAAVFDNAADAVSDRDFAVEFLSAAALAGVHISRLGEEIVLWTSSEFRFAELNDSFATGSSIMPQKKNPDVAELARAKSARITADLMHLLGVLKGLPLTYNRDLQEDKEPVFDAADCLAAALPALAGAVRTLSFNRQRLLEAAGEGAAAATDLAEALVLRGVPFRQAHEAVGKLVAAVTASGRRLQDATDEELSAAHSGLSREMLAVTDPVSSIAARRSHGGTAPERLAEQLQTLERIRARQSQWLEGI